MSDYLSAVETRLRALLFEGRGTDGSLGSDAQARAITAGVFREVPTNARLDDGSYPAEQFDRALSLRFTTIAPDPSPNNPYSSPQFDRVGLEITAGYIYGEATSFVDAQGTESASSAALRADRRAISDARRISIALTFSPLRGLDTDPVMVECHMVSSSPIDLGGGRYTQTTTFALVLQSTVTSAYGP